MLLLYQTVISATTSKSEVNNSVVSNLKDLRFLLTYANITHLYNNIYTHIQKKIIKYFETISVEKKNLRCLICHLLSFICHLGIFSLVCYKLS